MSEDTWTGRAHLNPPTVFYREPKPPAVLPPRDAFLVAHGRLALLCRSAPAPGFVVVAVDRHTQIVGAHALSAGDALVIGRHDHAGLVLPAPAISLRHLAALVRSAAGVTELRLWDLRTGVSFLTEDGQPAGGVLADGPLYISLDQYALWFLPAGFPLHDDPEAAWQSLPAREFLERAPVRPVPSARPHPRVLAESAPASVTRFTAPLLLGEGREPEVGWGELRIAGRGRKERRVVSAERLEQGLLLGRYERCGLVIETSHRISRVHLALIRIGMDVWAVDMASTNGVTRDGAPFSAGPLKDEDTLNLAGEVSVEWRRTQHALA